MSSILKRILADYAKRPVDPNFPLGYEESEAVRILRLRVDKATTLGEAAKKLARVDPAFMTLAKSVGLTADFGLTEEGLREVRDESPQELQRFIKIPLAERITQASGIYPEARAVPPAEATLGPQTRHHIEHLERQLAMERMRLQETRMQLAELDQKVRDSACKAVWLGKRYEEMDPEEVCSWVESEVLPALREVVRMASIEKGGAL